MDKSAVKGLVDRYLVDLRDALGMHQWTVNMVYGPIAGGAAGCVLADPKYREATITLDPEQFETEERVLDVLVHELSHLMHANAKTYRLAVDKVVSSEVELVLDELYDLMVETWATNLEAMLDVLGLPPKELVRRVRACKLKAYRARVEKLTPKRERKKP